MFVSICAFFGFEEEGNYADIEFEIIKGAAGYWYSKFTKKEAEQAQS